MAQMNLYVPDEVATKLKQEADRSGMSLSKYVLYLLSEKRPEGWPEGYFDRACGFLEWEFEEPADSLPEPVTE